MSKSGLGFTTIVVASAAVAASAVARAAVCIRNSRRRTTLVHPNATASERRAERQYKGLNYVLQRFASILSQKQLAISCVLVDEAQDFLPGEIAILRTLGERFFGVADSRQKIYKGQDSIKKLEKEINTVKLPFHYRNGHKICTVADGLAKEVTGEPTMLETSKYSEAKLESTVEPLAFPTLDEQCDELIDRLDTQIKAYPGELIGIACPRGEDLIPVVERLRNSVFADQLVVQTSDDGYTEFDPDKNICVSKLHSAKGLEFRAFHILAAEGLKKFPLQRELTFMGVTRAKTSLCIYHSADLPSYLEGALSKLNADTPIVGLDALLEADDEEGEE
jgi:superfamily I DNA/RNA helicase